MTVEEAINNINEIQRIITDAVPCCDPDDNWGRYTITLNTAVKALEKQIPKKPKNSDRMVCPVCNSKANYGHPYTNYCCHCGQKIDWSNTE